MAGAHETKTETTMEARVSGGGEAGAGGEVTKKMLPVMENPLVIRTEFSDQATMEARVSGGGEAGAGGEVTKKMLPVQENPLVIRTDFSDQATWEKIVAGIKTTTSEGFNAYVEFLDDPAFQGMTTAELLSSSEYKTPHSFLMIVDHATITEPEHPLLVVNLDEYEANEGEEKPAGEPEFGREFRAIPTAVQSIENNLSIANANFEDFANAVDEDGVFR